MRKLISVSDNFSKTNDNSMKKKKITKNPNQYKEEWDIYWHGKVFVMPDQRDTYMANDLEQWSLDDGNIEKGLRPSICIRDFYNARKLGTGSYYDLMEKYPKLKQAHILAKERISGRRQWLAMTRVLDKDVIFKTQGHWDEIYDSEQKKAAELRKPDQNIFVSGSLFKPVHELTDEVKPLIKKEEGEDV